MAASASEIQKWVELGVRVLIFYWEAFGGLLATGLHLISFGILLILLVWLWNRNRNALVETLEAFVTRKNPSK